MITNKLLFVLAATTLVETTLADNLEQPVSSNAYSSTNHDEGSQIERPDCGDDIFVDVECLNTSDGPFVELDGDDIALDTECDGVGYDSSDCFQLSDEGFTELRDESRYEASLADELMAGLSAQSSSRRKDLDRVQRSRQGYGNAGSAFGEMVNGASDSANRATSRRIETLARQQAEINRRKAAQSDADAARAYESSLHKRVVRPNVGNSNTVTTPSVTASTPQGSAGGYYESSSSSGETQDPRARNGKPCGSMTQLPMGKATAYRELPGAICENRAYGEFCYRKVVRWLAKNSCSNPIELRWTLQGGKKSTSQWTVGPGKTRELSCQLGSKFCAGNIRYDFFQYSWQRK